MPVFFLAALQVLSAGPFEVSGMVDTRDLAGFMKTSFAEALESGKDQLRNGTVRAFAQDGAIWWMSAQNASDGEATPEEQIAHIDAYLSGCDSDRNPTPAAFFG